MTATTTTPTAAPTPAPSALRRGMRTDLSEGDDGFEGCDDGNNNEQGVW